MPRTTPWSPEELLEAGRRFVGRAGHLPSALECCAALGLPSWPTVVKYFGSLSVYHQRIRRAEGVFASERESASATAKGLSGSAEEPPAQAGAPRTTRHLPPRPGMHATPTDEALRPCLGWCGQVFRSRHKGDRVCPACKRETAWSEGSGSVRVHRLKPGRRVS